MAAVRQDVASLGPGWSKTLLNYALAMEALDALPIAKRNSWKFLGAMHGFDTALWRRQRLIPAAGQVPADLTNRTYGNQCQHASWYFLPWHRGYLATFEAIVAATVKELTGDDWALPYWNYLDATNPDALKAPDAFLVPTMPNGRPNPLRKYPRRANFTALQPGPTDAFDLSAGREDDFVVGQGGIGFGGGITGDFAQFFNRTGDVENNPHNTVHRLVGGPQGGFMADPRLAALDPLFWLHHCNIDRIWEAWMRTPGKAMTTDPRWLNGPANRKFLMPAVDGGPGGPFTSRDTLAGGRFHPRYDDLVKGTGLAPAAGAAPVARMSLGPPEQQKVDVVGANTAKVTVGAKPAQSRVTLDAPAAPRGMAGLVARQAGRSPIRLYLSLESVRGDAPAPAIEVYVNVPEGAAPDADHLAGSLTLFGLNVASDPDGEHGGNGLGYTLDITELADRLSAAGDFDPDHLRVTLVPSEGVSDEAPITVDKISILKRTGAD